MNKGGSAQNDRRSRKDEGIFVADITSKIAW